ncbi:MAG: sigma-54-dependent Fis family transcriptional regulator, partial [Cytophagaceae bacterium]
IKRSVLLTQGDLIETDVLPREIISPQYLTSDDTGPSASVGTDAGRPAGAPNGQSGANLKSVSENAERAAILKVLEKTGYNKTKAAEVLNIDRKTLYNKLKAYDIHL